MSKMDRRCRYNPHLLGLSVCLIVGMIFYANDSLAQRGSCDWQEARSHIEWVLFVDRDARRAYRSARDRGRSPYYAVLFAQAHNQWAQDSIRACRSQAEEYLTDNAP